MSTNINNLPIPNPVKRTDVILARALDGTVYHNISGLPLFVSVEGGAHFQAGNSIMYAQSDSQAAPTTTVAGTTFIGFAAGDVFSTIFFVVPPGYYYKVSLPAGAVILIAWLEWQ